MAATAVLILSGGCAPRDDVPIVAERDGFFAGHAPAQDVGCSYQSASLSPDGSMAVLMNSSANGGNSRIIEGFTQALDPDRLVVLDTACVAAGGTLSACQVGTIEAGPTSQGVGSWWAKDSRHLLVNAGGRVAAFEVDRSRRAPRLVDEPRSHRFMKPWTLGIIGPTPSTSREQEWARVRAAERWFEDVRDPFMRRSEVSSMRVTLTPDGMTASGTISGSIGLGVLRRPQGAQVEDTGYTVSAFEGEKRPTLILDDRGEEWLIGMGEALRRVSGSPGVASKWVAGPRPGLFGKRPILDSATGRLIGVHTEREIAWIHPDADLAALEARLLATLPSSSSIEQLVISRAVGIAIAVSFTAGVEGGHSVLRRAAAGGAWQARYLRCADANLGSSVSGTTARTYDAGEPGWPVVARLHQRPASRRLLVYLHGGPDRSVLYDQAFDPGGWLKRQSGDVVSYDPSGTIGVDASVAQRLAEFGGEALERDAQLIVADVRRLAPNYEEVVLYAASYGGVLVPDVVRGLGSRLARAYLVAPLARHHDPLTNKADRAAARKRNFSDDFTVLFHDLHFGNRRVDSRVPFDVWLEAKYQGFTLDQRFMVVQGDRDEISRPGDVPHPGSARMIVVAGGHHAPGSHDPMLCWLARECDTDSRASAP